MRFRFIAMVLLVAIAICLPGLAAEFTVPNQQIQVTDTLQPDMSANKDLDIINSLANPAFASSKMPVEALEINTIKTLIPYEDLYKVLQQDIGKYFILPIEEFEALKAAKEVWLASEAKPLAPPPPLLYQINSVQLDGRLEENFAYIAGQFKIETFTEGWHEIPILWGSLAIETIKLNGDPATLKTTWVDSNTRRVNFGKMSQQNILQTALQSAAGGSDTLSQNNWKDTMFSLPVKGIGIHEVMIAFIVPIQNQDDLFTLQFNMTKIPLAFMKLRAADFILSVDNTSFKDYTIVESSDMEKGCEFIGWLGANSDVQLKWRRKFSRTVATKIEPQATVPEPATPDSKPIEEPVAEPKFVLQPLIYARSNTLISLGETTIQANKVIDFTISKAPVSSFTFNIPTEVEIVYVNADRPHSYRMIREGSQKRLRVEFVAGREDSCQIEISYEAPVDLTSTLVGIPEVVPLNVERELGTVAIEALTSVEVQPGNDDNHQVSKGVYPLDPLEAPQPLKERATRPILLAYRQNTHPSNILIAVKRYLDVAQQTVVADSMEMKTTFTTNQTSHSMISMTIRNNNKQYLQLQLASGSEITSAFRSGAPVKLVASKNDGKVQVPLEMSQTVGEPLAMDLQIFFKQPVDELRWKGNLSFVPPLVDIPVSRFSWYLYSPEDYHLFNFSGTVKETSEKTDPFFFRGFLLVLKLAWLFVTSPDVFFSVGVVIFIVLLIVARGLLFSILNFFWKLVCGFFSLFFGGKGFRLAELMIVVIILAVLASIATPNFRKARHQARDKACFANQRVLSGAVEMYNMDNDTMMTNLDINKLVKDRYLKTAPVKPESGCFYLLEGDINDRYISCRYHGSVDADTPRPVRQKMPAGSVGSFASKADRSESTRLNSGIAMGGALPTPSTSSGFGSTHTKGMLPIKSMFVMTKNHYSLERDLVITDVASNGALVANSTSPIVSLSYVHKTALKLGEIIAFVMALFAGLYFVSGAFMGYSTKISFAAVIIVILSIFDLQLKTIGESANAGLWLALIAALIWKTIWLLSKIKWVSSDDDLPPTPFENLPVRKHQMSSNDANPTSDSGFINITTLLVLTIILAVTLSLPAFAAQAREIRVMAPFKELSKVIPSGDRVVIIPEADYRYLKDITEPIKPEIISPQAFRFEAVNYSGTIEDRGVRFNGDFKIDLFNAGWKKIGLLSPTAVPSFASLNGRPLPMTLIENRGNLAYGFLTNATGSVNIKVNFFVPLDTSEYRHTSRFTLSTIPVCLSTLEITVKDRDCEAWIDPGVLIPAEKSFDKTVFKAILPPTDAVHFELYRNVIPQAAEAPKEVVNDEQPALDQPVAIEEKNRITVRQHNLLYFKEGFVSGTNLCYLAIKGGAGIASVSFQLPEKIRILKVENKLIEDWKINETSSPRRLDIIFKSKIRGNANITIEFEEDMQNLKDETYVVPEIYLPDAEQSYGILGIGCLQTLELGITPSQGFSPIVAAEFLKNWDKERPEKTPYAFNFLRHPNHMEITITRPEDISQQTAVIDRAEAMTLLNEDGYLLTRIVYEVKNNSQQFLKVKLPQIGSFPTELWSTQVAGLSVRTGFDSEHQAYNLPIVRSPINNGESKAFPVEIVYAIKTGTQLQAFNKVLVELPAAHLPISELSWIVYLPDGYELMRETGNVDRLMHTPETKFLDNSSYFSAMNMVSSSQMRQKTSLSQIQSKQPDRVTGMAGLLPVKFTIPTTSWKTAFSMLQIEPTGRAPYIEGMLVNPRKGKGFLFQAFMILTGMFTALSLVKIVLSPAKSRWFLLLALQAIIIAVAVYLKLYQADHFYQLGVSTALITYMLYRYFSFKLGESKGV